MTRTAYNVTAINETVGRLISGSPAPFVLFVDSNLFPAKILATDFQPADSLDVWYDDAANGGLHWPATLDYIAPVNYFNMTVPAGIHSPDALTFRALLVRKALIADRGFLDERFISVSGALKAWVHRSIYEGILFQPVDWNAAPSVRADETIPAEDQHRFIKFRFGAKWLKWSLMRSVLTGASSVGAARRSYQAIRSQQPAAKVPPRNHQAWRTMELPENASRVTVLIPTIERYPYMTTVLRLLEKQTIIPFEVIVIDQTPRADRKPGLFEGFERIGLRYFTLDEAGQCRSRNFGLQQAKGDYILFIDDDVEMDADLIERHLRCMHYFNADVSAGVADEVGAGPVPPDYSFIRLSDVFPTNNCMIRRAVLKKSGLFDMAYDRGQRADGDLGARIYKTGARMILNPEIRLLHYHAPRGGLRTHNVRRVTFASSRQFITHFRLPHVSELYFGFQHETERQRHEAKLLTLLGTFSIRGSRMKKILKVLLATVRIPSFLLTLSKRKAAAESMLGKYPQIPALDPSDNPHR